MGAAFFCVLLASKGESYGELEQARRDVVGPIGDGIVVGRGTTLVEKYRGQ